MRHWVWGLQACGVHPFPVQVLCVALLTCSLACLAEPVTETSNADGHAQLSLAERQYQKAIEIR